MLSYVIILFVYVSLTLPIKSCALYISIAIQCKERIHILSSVFLLYNRWSTKYTIFVIIALYITHYKFWWHVCLRYKKKIWCTDIIFNKNITASWLVLYMWLSVVHKITWHKWYHQTLKCRSSRCYITLLSCVFM